MQRKYVALIIGSAAMTLIEFAAVTVYELTSVAGSPDRTARGYLSAWSRGDTAAMRAGLTTPSPAGFDAAYGTLSKDLGVKRVQAQPGAVTKDGDSAVARFTATLTLPAGTWRYQGALRLVTQNRSWKVAWSPEAVHPDLHSGQHFTTTAKWPQRGRVLSADGTRIDDTNMPGSVQQLVGAVGPATAADLKRLGTPYRKGARTGHGGIQQRFERRLAGTPTLIISTAGASGRTVKTAGTVSGKNGGDVRTGLDLGVEQAAGDAIRGQTKPTSLVAIRPSTGRILAVSNVPGGFDRAMEGTYPPGSTFKVITAYALLRAGMTPSSPVQCPKMANVGGQMIHNSEGEALGAIDLEEALAQSCNTAFALQAAKMLTPAKLVAAAQAFGFNQKADPGVRAAAGSLPTPQDDAELAVAGFGQAKDLANAFDMAGVAAGIQSGVFRPPTLVTEPKVTQKVKTTRLDPQAIGQLRQMMGAVVTRGTAKDAGLPPGTQGKTGTAEYGSAAGPDGKLPTHAWFIACRGDLAVAVVVEGGGFGAKTAAPLVARFLNGLPS